MPTKSVEFTEDMHGFITKIETDNNFQGQREDFVSQSNAGKLLSQELKFRLTIHIDDIDAFVNDKNLEAKATGYIESDIFGGKKKVESGSFNLFVYPSESKKFDAAKEMHYKLKFKDQDDKVFTFFGFKVLQKEDVQDIWQETTTLYTQVFEGDQIETPLYAGILRLNLEDFMKQMTTFNTNAEGIFEKAEVYHKFLNVFATNLWEAYAPEIFNTEIKEWDHHIYPVHTSKGVVDAKITHHFIDLSDGITIQADQFKRKECKNIIVLLHGLSTSTDMFVMPEHYNLVQYLLNNEYTDVYSIDWRGSGRLKYSMTPNKFSLDHVAKYDIPETIEYIKSQYDEDINIHLVAHCIGSVCASAALSSGQLEGVSSFISNSVSFTPVVPLPVRIKLKLAPFFLNYVFMLPYMSAQAPYFPTPSPLKLLPILHKLLRHECNEPSCHMVSFMWGWGFPACYEHENLSEITHRRLKDLFGATTTSWYRHISKITKLQELVPYKQEKQFYELPDSYLNNLKEVELPPTLFFSGTKNKIFPGSNKQTFESIQKSFPQQNIEYQEFPGYGHQDVFMGKNSAEDIFPSLLSFIKRNSK